MRPLTPRDGALRAAILSASRAVLALALLLPAPSAAEGAVATLERASLLLDARETPPPDDDPRWQPVTLPDEWRKRRPEASGFAWYRLELPAPPPGAERLAAYLPSLGMNAAAWVNGRPIGSGGSFEEPVARNFNHPLYFPFSSTLLVPGRNVIHVRLFCYATPHHGYLGPVVVGAAEELRPRFEWQLFRQVRLAELATWLALVMLAFAGSIWLAARRDGVYGWFALATSFWALNSLNYWVRDPPIPTCSREARPSTRAAAGPSSRRARRAASTPVACASVTRSAATSSRPWTTSSSPGRPTTSSASAS